MKSGENEINASHLSSGVYGCVIKDKNIAIGSLKFIVE